MLINKSSEIKWSEVTPQALYLNRREFVAGLAAAGAAGAAGLGLRKLAAQMNVTATTVQPMGKSKVCRRVHSLLPRL